MKITLTDKEARITKIERDDFIVTIDFEWGGPDDRSIDDFHLDSLGKCVSAGGSLRSGWAVFHADKLKQNVEIGQTVPVLQD